jgi:hypothetical protein
MHRTGDTGIETEKGVMKKGSSRFLHSSNKEKEKGGYTAYSLNFMKIAN